MTLRKHAAWVPKSPRKYVMGHSAFIGAFRRGISKWSLTPEGSDIAIALNTVLRNYRPDFRFTSLVVNRNTQSQKHKDTKNCGASVIAAVGDFTGGDLEIWLDPDSETPTTIPIRNRLVSFFGYRNFHKNNHWEGERWSIIWFIYKSSLTRKWLATELQELEHLGFNLPQDPPPKNA